MVRNLVEMHAGTVQASSDGLGKGTEIVIRLPVLSHTGEIEQATEKSSGSPVVASPRCVLIADDNEDFADTMSRMLRRIGGHDVKVAYDGPQVLQLLEIFRPEAAFLDIGLPGIDGYELVQQLRKMPGLEKIVIVALTGYGTDEDRRRALAVGFDEHLTKPIKLHTLQRLIAERAEPS